MKYKYMRKLFSPIAKLLWPTKIINIENFNQDQSAIYACNHYTFFDTAPIITYLFKKDFHVLAKSEAFNNKFNKWFLKSANAIPVRRELGDPVSILQSVKLLKENKSLFIYPEGQRNKKGNRQLQDLKDGITWLALTLNKPIIPLMYYRPLKFFKRNYIIIGDPIILPEEFKKDINSNLKKASRYIYMRMQALRIVMDSELDIKYNKKLLKGKNI